MSTDGSSGNLRDHRFEGDGQFCKHWPEHRDASKFGFSMISQCGWPRSQHPLTVEERIDAAVADFRTVYWRGEPLPPNLALAVEAKDKGLATSEWASGLSDEADRLSARLADLTARIGFGDGITEPQADNDTIVKAVNEAFANSNTLHEVEAQVERVRELAEEAGRMAVLDNSYPPKWADDVLEALGGTS